MNGVGDTGNSAGDKPEQTDANGSSGFLQFSFSHFWLSFADILVAYALPLQVLSCIHVFFF